MAYLSVSYLFLIWWRDRRDPIKYAVVFLFVYAQGMAVYYFWSGLANHFWPVLPYVGLHVLAMLRAMGRFPRLAKLESGLVASVVTALGLMTVLTVPTFIRDRAVYRKVFEQQQTYRWSFDRAQVVSTIDPAPIAASIAQLERYSTSSDRGVCILSSLDNLLPFLARRHSVLPHFDLQWALLTQGERERFAGVLAAARPAFLFVGHEVEGDEPDPWESPWCGLGPDPERQSQRERIQEIRGLFDRVAVDYEMIERGPLLSVYRRRDVVAASPGQAAPPPRP